MKSLLATTAVLCVLAAPAAVLAQSNAGPAAGTAADTTAVSPSLNISRDWRTSKLIGAKVTNMQEQSVGKFGENPMLNADSWNQFVKMQGPAIQGLMTSYLEQSAQAFLEMQQQLQKQARSLFGAFQFPNFAAPFGQPEDGGNTSDGPGGPAHKT